MKTLNIYITALFLLLIAHSCTKVIDLKLRNSSGKLVIEGNITNIRGLQYIKLSQNISFTDTNNYPPVTGAIVNISDKAGNNYQLSEGLPGTYSNNKLTGKEGNAYTLTVSTSGKSYTASSVMPAQVVLDSITAKNNVFGGSNNRKNISVHYQDPAGVGNYYRFVMYVNGIQVKTIFAYNDDFNDGRYVDIQLREDDVDIVPGNTVRVVMQCVDKPIYTYWYTLMRQQVNGPGGGVTPSNPPNNITPDALGYFSAHTTQTKIITVK